MSSKHIWELVWVSTKVLAIEHIYSYVCKLLVLELKHGQALRLRAVSRELVLENVGSADVQPTQRFGVAMLYLKLYLFIFSLTAYASPWDIPAMPVHWHQ